MDGNLSLRFAETADDLERFWAWRDAYIRDDILPYATYFQVTDEARDWFFSKEYRASVDGLYARKEDPLRIVFFMLDGVEVGFTVYVTYHTEDGKCFILEFCVDKEYRDKQLGTRFFERFRDQAAAEGARYFAMNVYNEKNERFWTRNGFQYVQRDAQGAPVYELRMGDGLA